MSFKVEVKETAAFVYIDTQNSKINSVDDSTLGQLPSILHQLNCIANNTNIKYVAIISAKPNCFMTNMNFHMLIKRFNFSIDGQRLSKSLQKLIKCLMTFPKPVVAVITGECSSFGLELALACKYRVAIDGYPCTFSMTDIQWGLCSAAGGCLLLPRIVPLITAIDMILNGVSLDTEEAIIAGLLDHTLSLNEGHESYFETLHNVLGNTVKVLEETKQNNIIRKPIQDGLYEKVIKFFTSKCTLWRQLENEIFDQTHRLYPAPFAALEQIQVSLKANLDIDDHLEGYFLGERIGFGEISVTNQARSLLALQLHKSDQMNISEDDIMYIDYTSYVKTPILKTTSCNIDKSRHYFYPNRQMKNHCRMITKNSFDIESSNQVIVLVNDNSGTLTTDHINNNKSVFTVISAKSRPFDYKLYNNKTVCIRAFNYVHKVVEVVCDKCSSNQMIAAVKNFCLSQGNIVLFANNTPGSFLLRVLMAMLAEIIKLIVEGVDPWKLQRWLHKFGFIGDTVALLDEIGVDVIHQELCYLNQIYGQRFYCPESMKLLIDMIANGYLGKKVQCGFIDDQATNKGFKVLIRKYLGEVKAVSQNDAVDRVVYRLVNEALMCLQEGIIESSLDGDVAVVYGLGFPPAWGGPFRWVDIKGTPTVAKNMQDLNITPCKRLSENNKKFYTV